MEKCIKPNAFGNALGSSLAERNLSGENVSSRTKGIGGFTDAQMQAAIDSSPRYASLSNRSSSIDDMLYGPSSMSDAEDNLSPQQFTPLVDERGEPISFMEASRREVERNQVVRVEINGKRLSWFEKLTFDIKEFFTGSSANSEPDKTDQQLRQRDYSFPTSYTNVVQKQLGVSAETAKARILAEILRNSDYVSAQQAGGKHDYEIRSILGCQNLNCNGYKTDPYYTNHTYNTRYFESNGDLNDAVQQQLGNGKTYNELVKSNVEKDPVGVTVAGTGMIALGILTAGGVPTLMGMATGGAIGGTANASMQLAFTGSVDKTDVAVGTVTGALTFGTSVLPSVLINTGGALAGSGLKGDNPNMPMLGASLGTTVGFGFGSITEKGLNTVLNPWYRQEWNTIGLGISTWVPKSPVPSVFGTGVSAYGQEVTGNTTTIIMNKNGGK